MGAFLYRHIGLIARILLIPIFVYSGWRKVSAIGQTAIYIATTFVQHGVADAASAGSSIWRVLAVSSGVIELGCAALILLGWRTRFAGLLLIAYLVPVTVIFHVLGWLQAAEPQMAHIQALAIFKNVAIIGGLIQLATYGPGRPSVDVRD